MTPRYRGRAIEKSGWTVVVVEHVATGELIRVYRRLNRWRYYKSDAPVTQRAIVAAAQRFLATRASSSDEQLAQLALYPPSTVETAAAPG